jgi:hypothetical protein
VLQHQLPGRAQMNELAILLQEKFTALSVKLPAQEQTVYLQPLFRKAQRLAHCSNRNRMVAPKCPEHMNFDQVPEGQQRRLRLRWMDQRVEVSDTFGLRIRAAGYPRP